METFWTVVFSHTAIRGTTLPGDALWGKLCCHEGPQQTLHSEVCHSRFGYCVHIHHVTRADDNGASKVPRGSLRKSETILEAAGLTGTDFWYKYKPGCFNLSRPPESVRASQMNRIRCGLHCENNRDIATLNETSVFTYDCVCGMKSYCSMTTNTACLRIHGMRF